MVEVEEQVFKAIGSTVNYAVVPVGVGSFAQSAVSYWKSRPYHCTILTVEPDSAACLKTSLHNGKCTTIQTQNTIMSGMNCGTVSSIAWPMLRDGVDVCISVSDFEADQAVKRLHSVKIGAGPCGVATYAALQKLAREKELDLARLNRDSIVVLFCTEGQRDYPTP
jgi:diaminopropionate ammonia-lyase